MSSAARFLAIGGLVVALGLASIITVRGAEPVPAAPAAVVAAALV